MYLHLVHHNGTHKHHPTRNRRKAPTPRNHSGKLVVTSSSLFNRLIIRSLCRKTSTLIKSQRHINKGTLMLGRIVTSPSLHLDNMGRAVRSTVKVVVMHMDISNRIHIKVHMEAHHLDRITSTVGLGTNVMMAVDLVWQIFWWLKNYRDRLSRIGMTKGLL